MLVSLARALALVTARASRHMAVLAALASLLTVPDFAALVIAVEHLFATLAPALTQYFTCAHSLEYTYVERGVVFRIVFFRE